MGRHHRQRLALDETITLQVLQRLRKHFLAHAANLAAQFTEAVHPTAQYYQHQYTPATAHVIEHNSRRTISRHQLARPRFHHCCEQ